MFKFLRIACALIAAALAAVCVLVGVFTESLWAAIGVAAGAALFFAVCGFNFTGEGLRAVLDPKSGVSR